MKPQMLVACLLACGSPAYALGPSATDAATTVKIYLSGSSSLAPVVKAIAADGCASGTADSYQLAGDSANVFGVSCTVAAAKGGGSAGLGGKNVFIAYNASGGSAYGVYSIAKEVIPATNALNSAQATLLQRPQLANVGGGGICVAAGSVGGNPGITYNCTQTAQQYSDAGVADAEPSLFNVALNRPAAWVGQSISSAEFGKIDSAVQFQEIFGVAVSQNLYNDLQAMQVAQGRIATGGMPSLSRQAIANYLAGAFTDPASGFGWQALFATSPLAQPAAASTRVNICTRAAGSGAKAAANVFFLNNPCGSGALLPATAAQSVPGSFVVSEGVSTSAVTTCLSNANSAGQYAIGIAGKAQALPAGMQWVAISRVPPGRDGMKEGEYDWFTETSMQWNPTYLNSYKSLPGGVTAAQLTNYLGDFRVRSGMPNVMATYPAAAQDGVAAIDDFVDYLYNDPGNANNKTFVSRVTKLGASCAAPQWME